MPMLEGFMLLPMHLLVRFQLWDDVLRLPQPDAGLLLMNTHWRYARAVAFAKKGDVGKAEQEYQQFLVVRATVAADATCGLNLASNVAAVAEPVIVTALQAAVAAEDRLSYNEPKDWISPVREMLGGVLLRSGDYAGAEKVFRADLLKNPKSGRSLFGLAESLKGQGKSRAAAQARRQFAAAWRQADIKLTVADL
jgi:tetratricopeptide (TPR) repeat protein